MMLTSAEGSGCPLPASVTTPVISALETRTGSAIVTWAGNNKTPTAMSARARAEPARARVENIESSVIALIFRAAGVRGRDRSSETVGRLGYAIAGGARGRLGAPSVRQVGASGRTDGT